MRFQRVFTTEISIFEAILGYFGYMGDGEEKVFVLMENLRLLLGG